MVSCASPGQQPSHVASPWLRFPRASLPPPPKPPAASTRLWFTKVRFIAALHPKSWCAFWGAPRGSLASTRWETLASTCARGEEEDEDARSLTPCPCRKRPRRGASNRRCGRLSRRAERASRSPAAGLHRPAAPPLATVPPGLLPALLLPRPQALPELQTPQNWEGSGGTGSRVLGPENQSHPSSRG